jgi:hypothetical protein
MTGIVILVIVEAYKIYPTGGSKGTKRRTWDVKLATWWFIPRIVSGL